MRRVERLVQAEIARITRLVDDLLLLAKAEQTEFLQREPIELPEYVRDLWDGMSLIAVRRFEWGRCRTVCSVPIRIVSHRRCAI